MTYLTLMYDINQACAAYGLGLHRIHADTVGELPNSGTGGERCFLTIVEEFSSHCEVVVAVL